MKKYLFIIDPQNDFIEGGSLAVPGGKEALQRIVDSGILDREDWNGIVVSIDSHNPSHLGFGEPKTELRKHLLKNIQRPTPWPPHCVIDTHGWEIYEPLQSKLISLGEKVVYIEKGRNDRKDSYSLMDVSKGCITVGNLLDWGDIEIYWTGLAEDYCVYESIKGVMGMDGPKKIHHILLSDMTACIKNHLTGDENLDVKPYTL